jgi:hypothetical protein
MKRKSLKQFIRDHREEIDRYIQKQSLGARKNDEERRLCFER